MLATRDKPDKRHTSRLNRSLADLPAFESHQVGNNSAIFNNLGSSMHGINPRTVCSSEFDHERVWSTRATSRCSAPVLRNAMRVRETTVRLKQIRVV